MLNAYVKAYALSVSAVTATADRANLYRVIDQVNEESEPLTITGQRGNAVLVTESDWWAMQEALYITAIPALARSIHEARKEGCACGVIARRSALAE